MDSFDFKRVEEELQERLKPGTIGGIPGLSQQQGWSSACYGTSYFYDFHSNVVKKIKFILLDEISDDEFQPLKSRNNMYSSTTSNFMNASMASNTSLTTSIMHQSMTDSLNLSTYKSAYAYTTSQAHNQPQQTSSNNCEKTKFSLSFASVSFLLLHKDILSLSPVDGVFPDSLTQMQTVSRAFFEALYYFGATVKGEKDIAEVRDKMNGACDRSHHRVIAAPLKIKGTIRTTPTSSTETMGSLAVGYFEIIESLKGKETLPSPSTPSPSCIEVLTFPRNFEKGVVQCVKLEFKTESRKLRGNKGQGSKTNLKFILSECKTEVDISVVDRINALLNSPLWYYMEPRELRHQVRP